MARDADLAALASELEADPSCLARVRPLGDAAALAAPDGDAALRWHLAVLRALMADPPDGDAVRELYGELVDRYRGSPDRLAALRPIGAEIRSREHSGALASTLVARSDRKKPKT